MHRHAYGNGVRIFDAHDTSKANYDCSAFCGDNGGSGANDGSGHNSGAVRALVLQCAEKCALPRGGMSVLRRVLRKHDERACTFSDYAAASHNRGGQHSVAGAEDNGRARSAGDDCPRN
jgi:hypothetical protein